MVKPATRPHSRYSREAVTLLAGLIRAARKEQMMTVLELASRAGVSRGMVQRIEKGDLNCAIGAVFEVAAIVGVNLFGADGHTLASQIRQVEDKLTLLPQSIRKKSKVVADDF